MMKNVNIKNFVEEVRKSANLSQEQLAVETDVHWKTIRSVEQGKHKLSLELALRIADALEVSVDNLFKLEGGKR
ncbi:helix-turn-helix transcriptional regulator [Enterococcus rotai]|uniref:helix-turn-helix transcriptional regulator n=1 Tax=Enterococcus rotai TaxID=118060 RepID=UPI0032B43516